MRSDAPINPSGEPKVGTEIDLRAGFVLLGSIGLYLTYVGWIAQPRETSKEPKP